MQPKQSKITQKLALRTALGLFVLAALVLAFQWYRGREADPGGSRVTDTTGWITAVETVSDGKQTVLFKADGTIVRQPKGAASSEDRDAVWRPDGNFVFFSSNRDKGKFTIFRWSPDGGSAEMRSIPGLSQSAPFFLRSDADRHEDADALVCAGGRVVDYDPKKPALPQILPPRDPNVTAQGTEGEGGGSPFEGVYERYGSSFRIAKWTPDKKAIFAIMRRDVGEILIYQKLDFKTPQEGEPKAIVAGDRIDFDIDQDKGIVYFAVENFQWPDAQSAPAEFRKGTKLDVPYRHGIGRVDLSQEHPMQMIVASKDDKFCFSQITLSPAGDALAAVGGTYSGNGNLEPKGIFVFPPTPNQTSLGQPVATGETFEPSWSPDGKLAFARRESPTSRPIYVLEKGSQTPRRMSPAEGIFGYPVFSPQAGK